MTLMVNASSQFGIQFIFVTRDGVTWTNLLLAATLNNYWLCDPAVEYRSLDQKVMGSNPTKGMGRFILEQKT